jgi:hypothetical protein
MDKQIYQAIIVGVIGLFIILAIMISTVVMLINYKRWANRRDIHYTEKHDSLEKKVDHIENTHGDVIDKATEVIEAAKDLLKKK